MSSERFGGLRARIAVEAARLMIEEDVKQYFTAKRLAAKRLLGRVQAGRMRYRPADLPSNGEIRDAVLLLSQLSEGASRMERLFSMRVLALEVMTELAAFRPRLIGSVSTGHIRRGSDIDLHVFPETEEVLSGHLARTRWRPERELVSIYKHNEIREYVHYRIELDHPVELTVYDPRELRRVSRSSTDGKPIVRVTPKGVLKLLETEHAEVWSAHLRGEKNNTPIAASEEERPGPWDGLLDDEDDWDMAVPEPGEEEDPEQLYEPLAGFEGYS